MPATVQLDVNLWNQFSGVAQQKRKRPNRLLEKLIAEYLAIQKDLQLDEAIRQQAGKSGYKEIRKTIFEKEWWFVVEDVVFALTDSNDPKQYIQRIKQRDPELGKGWVQIVHTLEVTTEGGNQK